MITLGDLASWWQQFFHQAEPVATLCVFRIALALLVAFNAACLLPFANDLFGPDGLLGTQSFAQTYRRPRLTVFQLLPATHRSAPAMIMALLVLSLALAVGFETRFTAPLAWLALVSLHHRNPLIFNSGDTVQRLLLLLLCFTPSGAALSVDCWRRGEDVLQAMADQKFDPWALRLMQIQVSMIYLRTVGWKLRGKTWRDGTAIAYALGATDFVRCPAPGLFSKTPVVQILTFGTLVAESFIGLGVWVKELRYAAILTGWALHLGIGIFLNVHLFGLTMCVALITYLPPADLARWCLNTLR